MQADKADKADKFLSGDDKKENNKKTVVRVPNRECAYNNVLYHCKQDFPTSDELYLVLKDQKDKTAIYASVAHPSINPGTIAINQVVRTRCNLKLGDSVSYTVLPHLNRRFCQLLRLNISVRVTTNASDTVLGRLESSTKASTSPKNNSSIQIHPETFRDALKTVMADIYFNPNQMLVMNFCDNELIIRVTQGMGVLSDNTKIELKSDDLLVQIVDENLMSRELFQPDFSFETIGIGGLDNQLSSILRRAMGTRAISSETVSRLGIKHAKGLILYGPPGTGKTLIARNLGKLLSKVPPIVINGPELLNKYVGQSEENLRNIFKAARENYDKDKEKSPLHVFIFDEIDAICKQRGSSSSGVGDSMVNQLLTLLDGVNSLPNIFVIGMTNRLDLLDEALIRPGRLGIKVKISLPDEKGRKQIFNIHMDKMRNNKLVESSIDIDDLVDKTNNFSGAEIEAVVDNASSYAIGDYLVSVSGNNNNNRDTEVIVTNEHFQKAIVDIIPSYGNKELSISSISKLSYKNMAIATKIFGLLSSNRSTERTVDDVLTYLEDAEKVEKAEKEQKSLSILLTMEPKTGKTSIMKKICQLVGKIGYTRMIQAMDIIKKTESGKAEFVVNIIENAHESGKSLVIIDDIDIVLDFVSIRGRYDFSNRLYQILRTILKTIPENQFYFICTTSDKELTKMISQDFDFCFDRSAFSTTIDGSDIDSYTVSSAVSSVAASSAVSSVAASSAVSSAVSSVASSSVAASSTEAAAHINPDNTPFKIASLDIEKYNEVIRSNIEPFRAAASATPTEYPGVRYIDETACSWVLVNGVFKDIQGRYTFQNARIVKTSDGDTVIRFTCTQGLTNGWLDILVSFKFLSGDDKMTYGNCGGEGQGEDATIIDAGYPHVDAYIDCANKDGTMNYRLLSRQLKRLSDFY